MELTADGFASCSAFEMLTLPGVTQTMMMPALPGLGHADPSIIERLVIESQYAHHIQRQSQTIASFLRDEALVLEDDLDYASIGGMSTEMKERLSKIRPTTFVSRCYIYLKS